MAAYNTTVYFKSNIFLSYLYEEEEARSVLVEDVLRYMDVVSLVVKPDSDFFWTTVKDEGLFVLDGMHSAIIGCHLTENSFIPVYSHPLLLTQLVRSVDASDVHDLAGVTAQAMQDYDRRLSKLWLGQNTPYILYPVIGPSVDYSLPEEEDFDTVPENVTPEIVGIDESRHPTLPSDAYVRSES